MPRFNNYARRATPNYTYLLIKIFPWKLDPCIKYLISDRRQRCVSDREYWRPRYFLARRNFRSCETRAYNYTPELSL